MGIFNWFKNLFSTPAPAPKAEPKAKAAPKVTKASLTKLTKAQIEEKGREFGIEVDKRQTKDKIVSQVLAASKKA